MFFRSSELFGGQSHRQQGEITINFKENDKKNLKCYKLGKLGRTGRGMVVGRGFMCVK